MRRLLRHVALGCSMLALASLPAAALAPVEEGIYQLAAIDDLLALRSNPDVQVLVLDEKLQAKQLSDAHIKITREWIEAGGVLWVVEDGLRSALTENIAPFVVRDFDYKKSTTGKRGGELVVRGVSPRHVLGDHPLMDGVDQLFLFPRYRFDGTEKASALVTLTDTKGNTGVVMAALPLGKGLMVLDGTARKKNAVLSKVPGFKRQGFSAKHPNSRKDGESWNDYDWTTLRSNAVRHAATQLRPAETVGTRTAVSR